MSHTDSRSIPTKNSKPSTTANTGFAAKPSIARANSLRGSIGASSSIGSAFAAPG
jgi:hypothetical protein